MSVNLTAAPTLPDINDPATFNARALALLSWMTGTLVTEINGMNAADFFSVQSSATDTTSGRVLTVGAFGLGSSASPDITDFTSQSIAPGFYRAHEATVIGGPAGYSSGYKWICIAGRAYSSSAAVLMSRQTTTITGQRSWIGVKDTETGAMTWQEIPLPSRWIGTVSQSSGIPTGAIIEKGSSANGYYRRFACGKLECWHTKAASSGGSETWTFPSAFIEAPVVVPVAVNGSVSASAQLDAAPSTTAATYSVRDKADARRADTVHLFAVGRWSALT